MIKREPQADQTYLDAQVAYRVKKIEEFQELAQDPSIKPENLTGLRYDIFLKLYQLLILGYSQGAPVSTLKQSFPAVVKSLVAYQAGKDSEKFVFDQDIDDYVVSLWLVSLALLFEVDDQLFAQLVELIDNAGQDKLYDCLVRTRIKRHPQTERLIYPNPYKLLLDAIEAVPEKQAELMKQFLKNWYSSMKKTYWYNRHMRLNAGFFGYWCIEAAGAVKAFGIDDTSFRDMPYYPKDLVHPQEPQS